MSRDASSRAQQANDQAMSLSKTYGNNATSLAGQLTPIYTQQATNPQGMTPDELNNANTASMEAAGGAVAGAQGEGERKAAATGNAGGYQAALADAAKRGIASNSQSALKVQNMNTALKETQRESGVAGLQGLQSQDQSGAISALSPAIGAVNAETGAGQSGWFQNMVGLMNALKPGFSTGGGAGTSVSMG